MPSLVSIFRAPAIALSALAALSLTACGSPRPTAPPDLHACPNFEQRYRVVDDYARAYAVRPPQDINVLELSAGGEFGAYGSGFLQGWGSVGETALPAPRNSIKSITGVSTGALMSTYAFLGKDDDLVTFYTTLDDSKVYSKHSLLGLIWANSLYDASGKAQLLRQWISTDIVRAVAAQPDDRHLYIGMTNLDSGEFVRIDMVKLARDATLPEAQRLDCYQAVIDAATAVEIALPPVFIDQAMYGDGGARRHLFLVSPNYYDPDFQPNRDKLRLFSLVQGDLQVLPQTTPNGVLDIAQRTASLFTDQTLKDSVELSNALATDPKVIVGESAAQTLPIYKTFWAAAAAASCDCFKQTQQQCGSATSAEGADLFCQPFMQCLAQAGKADGASYARTGKWLDFDKLNLGTGQSCPARALGGKDRLIFP